MSKPRSDSLFAELKRLDVIGEFFVWFYQQAPSYDEIHEKLSTWGCDRSDGAVHNLISRHGLQWKVEESVRQSESTLGLLPKDSDKRVREMIKQHEFNLSFQDLTNKEKFQLLRFDLDKRSAKLNGELEKEKLRLKEEAEKRSQERLTIDRKKFQRETCVLFLKWHENKNARQIAESRGLQTSEKVEQLGQQIFGEDW